MPDLAARHAAVVARHGAWTAHNIHLGEGVWTIGPGLAGASERNLRRVVQTVADVVATTSPAPAGSSPGDAGRGRFAGLRVLDLACLEGLYGVELARQGASVVAVEAREPHVEKVRFARDALGLGDRLEVVHGDVREATAERHGRFDVVLCLGILYHLEAADAVALLRAAGEMATRAAIVETQVALAPREARGGVSGLVYEEPSDEPWASVGNRTSFWLTRPSLLNALADAGFTSVSEVLSPAVPDLAAYRDHVQLLALKGEPVELRGVPPLDPARWPERMTRHVHPAQGLRHALAERAKARLRHPLAAVFSKR